MRRLGYFLHVLVTMREGEVDEASLAKLRSTVDRVDLVERTPKFQSFATLKPTLIASNNSLANFPLSGEYDLTLAESEHVTPIFDNPLLRTRIRVLRVHNNERKYMWELARANKGPNWKLFFAAETLRYHLLGDKQYKKLDALWFISKIEFETYSRSQLAQKVQPMWLPPSLNLKNMPRRTRSDSKRVLFVGGLANPLNQEGIRWYLSKVHPNLKSFPDYEFVIAGSAGKSESARLLALEADGIDRCSVQLDIENLNPLYDSCALLINPMRNGSGVKMKTVHAVQHNIPLVTTTVGAEGSGLVDREHIRVADEPEEFLSAVSDLLSNPAMGDSMSDRAYRYLAANYNSDENIERLLNLLLGPSTKAEPVLG